MSSTNIYNSIQNLYNMDKTTWQEVLAELYNLVADTNQKFDNFENKFILMIGKEVTDIIKEMYEDGTLATIINEQVFSQLNNKIDKVKQDLINLIEEKEKTFSEKINNIVLQTDVNDITTVLENALNDYKEVKLLPKEYVISKKIIIPENTSLILSKGTTIKTNGNFYAFELKGGSLLKGGIIDVSNVENLSGGILLDGASQINLQKGQTLFGDLFIKGNLLNDGITFKCDGLSNEQECIGWVNIENINLTNFNNAILLKCNSVTNSTSWINSNNFNNIGTEMCKQIINILGTSSKACCDNNKFNIVTQCYMENSIVNVSYGNFNQINLMPWDLEVYLSENKYFVFDSHSNNNILFLPLEFEKYITDKGFHNIIKSNDNNTVYKNIYKSHLSNINYRVLNDGTSLTIDKYENDLWKSTVFSVSDNGINYNGAVKGDVCILKLPNGFRKIMGSTTVSILGNGYNAEKIIDLPQTFSKIVNIQVTVKDWRFSSYGYEYSLSQIKVGSTDIQKLVSSKTDVTLYWEVTAY